MARPKKWFASSEYNQAKKAAKAREESLYKYARNTRNNGVDKGFYVGSGDLPARLQNATVEQKSV